MINNIIEYSHNHLFLENITQYLVYFMPQGTQFEIIEYWWHCISGFK